MHKNAKETGNVNKVFDAVFSDIIINYKININEHFPRIWNWILDFNFINRFDKKKKMLPMIFNLY